MEDNFGLAKFPTGLFPNPVYLDVVASGRDDYLPSDILVNTMNATKDPRRAVWFTTVGGEYKGECMGNSNSFGSFLTLLVSFQEPKLQGICWTLQNIIS